MSSVFSPVSFLVVTYNQEKYIRAAFESALRQEGFPIEIVVTDDHSTDRTFEIVKQIAEDYRGPHKIILNQNPKNLGIVPQVNRAVSLSSGELIVGMAGDDISLPHRARRSYEEWCKSGKKAHSIFFNAQIIDQDSRELGIKFVANHRYLRKNRFDLTISGGKPWQIFPVEFPESAFGTWVLGATHAFSRKGFEVFGPLRCDLPAEDHAIPYRSLLLGEVRYVHETLVLYRRHENNYWPDQASPEKRKQLQMRELRNVVTTHQQAIADINQAEKIGLLERGLAQRIRKHCRREVVQKGLNRAVYSDHPFTELWRFLRGDLFVGNPASYYRELFLMTLKKGLQLKGFHLFQKLFGATASDEPNKKIVKAQKASPAPSSETK